MWSVAIHEVNIYMQFKLLEMSTEDQMSVCIWFIYINQSSVVSDKILHKLHHKDPNIHHKMKNSPSNILLFLFTDVEK